MPHPLHAAAAILLFAAPASIRGQTAHLAPPPALLTSVAATHADHAPVIDGRDDDAVWSKAHAVTAFREFDPVEDGDPRFRTEFKIAYDSRNIYVFIRAYDPEPSLIRKTLARRDIRPPTDQLKVMRDCSTRVGSVASLSYTMHMATQARRPQLPYSALRR